MYEQAYHQGDLSNYRFLITGGAGFIGSNIVEYLLKYGAKEVRVLDNLSNGFLSNLESFKKNPRFTFIEGTIEDLEVCQKACEDIDFISHQAALGSVPRSIQNPIATHQANVTGILNMLWAAKSNNIKSFAYASSSSVYGDHPQLPKVENLTGNMLSPYAVSKMSGEHYAHVFYKNYVLPTIGLRYFNVFGPRQSADLTYAAVIPLFAKAILNDTPPTVFGDGEQSRDFTFIENVVQANVKAMLEAKEEAYGEAFNIGNQSSTSILDLIEIINSEVKKNISPVFAPPRKGDVKNSLADISKAQNLLGYHPKFSFREGIALAMNWYEKLFTSD